MTAVLVLDARLIARGPGIHIAMARCIARRLAAAGNLLVAAPPDSCGAELADSLGIEPRSILDQKEGDPGTMLDASWRQIGMAMPVAFFDSSAPDVPDFALARIPAELRRVDAAIGPTHHGGLWTFAARRYRPWLFHRIDWERPDVYDALCRRAAEDDLELAVLPLWPTTERLGDLDGDLDALRGRLALASQPAVSGHPAASMASLEALRELATALGGSALPSE